MCKYKNKSVFPSQRETTAGSSLTLRPHLKARIDTYERRPKINGCGGCLFDLLSTAPGHFFQVFLCCLLRISTTAGPPTSLLCRQREWTAVVLQTSWPKTNPDSRVLSVDRHYFRHFPHIRMCVPCETAVLYYLVPHGRRVWRQHQRPGPT